MSGRVPRGAGPAFLLAVALASVHLLAANPVAATRLEHAPQSSAVVSTLALQLDRADRLAAARQGAEAKDAYVAAISQARAEKNQALELRALESIGRLLTADSRFAEARPFLDQALSLAEALNDRAGAARTATSLGNAAADLNQAAEARSWYEKAAALAIDQPRLRATALLDLIYLESATPAARQVLEDEVLAIARGLGDKELEARVLHAVADRQVVAGALAAGMANLEKAAALYEAAGAREGLAVVYTSLGRINRLHGRADLAIPYYDKALALQQKDGDKIGQVQTLNAMGVAWAATPLDDFARAQTFYEKAYALALETTSARAINFMRGNLAGNLLNLGEFARSAQLLEALFRDGGDAYPAIRHSQLSRACLGLGRLREARAHADTAVDLAAASPDQLVTAYNRRAPVRERQGDTEGALDDYRRAIGVIEGMRASLVPADFMRQGFVSQYNEIFSGMIALHAGHGHAGLAIEAAETARARALLDELAARDIRTPGSAKPADLQALVAAARRAKTTILTYWVGDDGLFIGVVPPSGVAAMRRVDITPRGLERLVQAAVPAAAPGAWPLSAKSRGAAQIVASPSAKAPWRALERILVEPVRALLPPAGGRLTIVPHRSLMRLPFAALVGPTGRYLLEDYTLHYTPAGALLDVNAADQGAAPQPRTFLFVADPALPAPGKGEPSLGPLPGALDEVRTIARLLPAGSAVVLDGARADRVSVEAAMPDASVIHFATHGVANDGEPLDSYLALAQPTAGGKSNRLTAQDVYTLRLKADLVVLGSCRSAGGQVTGEGVSALVRAFFFAGARSIVASVWDVPDEPANRLLPAFYESWLKKRPAADAMRAAQLRLLSDLRAGRVRIKTPVGEVALPENPALWAGFIVLGQFSFPSPPLCSAPPFRANSP